MATCICYKHAELFWVSQITLKPSVWAECLWGFRSLNGLPVTSMTFSWCQLKRVNFRHPVWVKITADDITGECAVSHYHCDPFQWLLLTVQMAGGATASRQPTTPLVSVVPYLHICVCLSACLCLRWKKKKKKMVSESSVWSRSQHSEWGCNH